MQTQNFYRCCYALSPGTEKKKNDKTCSYYKTLLTNIVSFVSHNFS